MILPNDKRTEEDMKRMHILNSILSLLKDKPLSISQISKKMNINRSTMRYYLSLLKQENLIYYERQQNTPGRPTFIKINEEKEKEFWKKIKEEMVRERKAMKQSKITKEILKELYEKSMSPTELAGKVKYNLGLDMITDVYNTLSWLQMNGYIQEQKSITRQGKNLLENTPKNDR